MDLTDWKATKEAIKPHLPIQYLVNNAAMAILDPFLEAKPEDFDLYVLNNCRDFKWFSLLSSDCSISMFDRLFVLVK